MKDSAERRAWVYAAAGLVSGLVLSSWLRPVWRWPIAGPLGVAELFLVAVVRTGIGFWALLIVAIVRGFGMLRSPPLPRAGR